MTGANELFPISPFRNEGAKGADRGAIKGITDLTGRKGPVGSAQLQEELRARMCFVIWTVDRNR